LERRKIWRLQNVQTEVTRKTIFKIRGFQIAEKFLGGIKGVSIKRKILKYNAFHVECASPNISFSRRRRTP
jgi:hypothetical protein